MKKCFKCGESKPLSAFYKHKMMADGHLNKCKECTKADVKLHREANIERIRAYDRERGSRQDKYYLREYRKRNPEKNKARAMVNYHVRAGNMTKKPCEVCGATGRVEGHHDDYSKPLDVRWLCSVHHKQVHKESFLGE